MSRKDKESVDEQCLGAVPIDQDERRLNVAMSRLLDRLRPFMKAYPDAIGDKMPEHSLTWVEHPGYGPGSTLLEAFKTHPVLWRGALPDGVCIVPRRALETMTNLSPEAVNYLVELGEQVVADHGARCEYEAAIARTKPNPEWTSEE